MKRLWMLSLLLTGCPDDGPEDEPDAGLAWQVHAEAAPGAVLLGAWPVGDELIFVGGQLDGTEGALVRLGPEGACLQRAFAPRLLWWAHGASPARWYAVGSEGQILRVEGQTVVDESVPTESTLYGVWDAGDRAWAVGGDARGTELGEVWVREEGAWRLFASELPGVLFKVWRDWFVGDGVAYRLEDEVLVAHPPPDGEKLLTVTGRGPDDVWAVGGATLPQVLHWTGRAWTSVEFDPFCANQGLNGVWTAPGEDVWVAGFFGAVARYDGAGWTCPRPRVTQEHLHVVIRHEGATYAGGGNLFFPNEPSTAALLHHGADLGRVESLPACP